MLANLHDNGNAKSGGETEELRRELEFVYKITDANAPMIVWDTDSRITRFNHAFEHLSGYTADEVIGKDLEVLFPEDSREASLNEIRSTLSGEFWESVEIPIRRKDGDVRIALWNSANIYADDGKTLVATIAQGQDITDRKEAERALSESEEKYRTMIEQSNDLIWTLDTDGYFTFFNKRAEEISGYRLEEWRGKSFAPLLFEEDLPAVANIFQRTLLGEPVKYEVRVKKSDGGILWLSVNTAPFHRNGKVAGTVSFGRDITDRKEAEHKLRETSNYLESLLDYANAPMIVWDTDSRITRFNHAFEHLSGYTADEVIGKDLEVLFPEDSREASLNEIRSTLSGEFWESVEIPIRRKDGDVRIALWNSANIYADDGKTLVATIAQGQDITDRKEAEQELKERMTLSQLGAGIGVLLTGQRDLRDLLQRCALEINDALNAAFTRIWVLDPEDDELLTLMASAGKYTHLDGTHSRIRIDSELKVAIIARNKKAVLTNDVIHDPHVNDHEWAKKEKMTSFAGYPLIVDKELVGVIALFSRHVLKDFTLDSLASIADEIAVGIHRLKTTSALQLSEEKYRSLFEESKDGVFVSTPEGKFLDVNQSFVDMLGYDSKDELLEANFEEDLFFDKSERLDYLDALEEHGFVRDFTLVKKSKSGEKVILSVTAGVVRDESGEVSAYRGIVRDVTEHRRLEEQLFQAQKMESIGRLAGGVAHDLNNFLTAVKGYTDLALLGVPEDSEAKGELRLARQASDRASNLTRQLLLFSRREPLKLRSINLGSVSSDLGKMLRRLIGEKYSLAISVGPSLWPIEADTGQIEQIIMNLIVNAKDAMADGGEIRMATTNLKLENDMSSDDPDSGPGNYVCLSVEDSGTGMDENTRLQIFEPFFTTKSAGKGTGLGLSVVYGIVKQHGGWVDVDSTVGLGTTFRIYFPAVERAKSPELAKMSDRKDVTYQGERVLLVEDEEILMNLAEKMLDGIGFEVITAADAETALELFRQKEGNISLLFSDVVLPGENGTRLAQRLLAENPEMRILLTSGYSETEELQTIEEEGYSFIQKPYALVELYEAIREVMPGG